MRLCPIPPRRYTNSGGPGKSSPQTGKLGYHRGTCPLRHSLRQRLRTMQLYYTTLEIHYKYNSVEMLYFFINLILIFLYSMLLSNRLESNIDRKRRRPRRWSSWTWRGSPATPARARGWGTPSSLSSRSRTHIEDRKSVV